MSKQSTPMVLSVADWNPSAIRYMQPKVNDLGGKSINLISTQTGRSLHFSTPLMMTWGISDFTNAMGEQDGKFSMSLNFPNSEYATPATTAFLEKVKAFENQILDDAVRNADAWFNDDSLSRDVLKHSFYPILKYSKDKLTKKVDTSKAPSMKAKVPNYNNKWNVEIYDTNSNLLFPGDNDLLTPMDFVPKLANVACVLQCGGIWIGGKGWGVTFKLVQAVVKKNQMVSVFGQCHIQLSNDEIQTLEHREPEDTVEETYVASVVEPVSTEVADSDDEGESEEVKETEPVVEKPAVVKKIVKKAIVAEQAPVQAPAQAVAVANEPAVVKKKIVKKVTA